MNLHPRPPFSYRTDSTVLPFDDSGPIVFMDGNCALCTGGARLISRLDHRGEFRICPTLSPLGQSVLKHYGLNPADPDSWLYLEDGKAYDALDAIIRTGARLGGVGLLAQPFRLLPQAARDWLYRRIARNRYRLFGRADMCATPDPALQRRLIG